MQSFIFPGCCEQLNSAAWVTEANSFLTFCARTIIKLIEGIQD